MKIASLSVAIALLSAPAFAQDPGSETVTVEASRIPYTSFGPIAWSGGPGENPGHGCAEPSCGELPPDPGGATLVTQQQKTEKNKQAKQKAKANQGKIAPSMKNDRDIMDLLFGWMSGAKVDASVQGTLRIQVGDTKIDGKGCAQYHAQLKNEGKPVPDFCVQRDVNAVPVQRVNGTYEHQLELNYVIYPACYWDNKCGYEAFTFIAGSINELKGFLNETIGETYY